MMSKRNTSKSSTRLKRIGRSKKENMMKTEGHMRKEMNKKGENN